MKILFSILLNASILLLILFLLGANADLSLEAGVVLGCDDCGIFSKEALKTYAIGGIILGVLNTVIRPILKILSLPLFFIFLGLTTLLVNGVVLYLFSYIMNQVLIIPGVGYEFTGNVSFVIAVAIFTVLNTLYSLLFFKK